MKKFRSVAIDGPAGAGKSTLARQAARELGYLYVDTGAIYRTVALRVLRSGADASDPAQVISLLDRMEIRMDYGADGEQRMFLDGEDVTRSIRENAVSGLASQVSAIPAVRDFLLEYQRATAREHNVVMDGRDIGTVVLPDADVKIFLTASLYARARRRVNDLVQRGQTADFETIRREVEERDLRDQTRSVAPLKRAEDATVLDTSSLTLEESLLALLKLIREPVVP